MTLPKNTFAFIRHFIQRQPFGFAIIFLAAIFWSVNDLFFPYFLKLIVDILQLQQGPKTAVYTQLAWPVGLLLFFWILTEFLLRMQGIAMIYVLPQFRADIRSQVFNYVKRHSHEYFSNHFSGNIAKKIAELPTSAQSVIEVFAYSFIPTIVGIVIAVVLMWFAKPIFAFILLIWFSLHILLTLVFMRMSNLEWEIHSESSAILSGKIVDSFTNILNVRLFARNEYEGQYLQQFQYDEIKKAKKAMWLIEIMRFCQGIIGFLLIFFMISTLVYGWTQGEEVQNTFF